MSILLYCAAERGDAGIATIAGVGGQPVFCIEHSGVVLFCSQNPGSDAWAKPALADSVKQFHAVLRQVFANQAILPFRFPTILADEKEAADHLRKEGVQYSAQLRRFADGAQMEVVITDRSEGESNGQARSGTEYLREKQRREERCRLAANAIQDLSAELARDWKQRHTRNGLRLFALVKRDSVPRFLDLVRTFSVPPGLAVRVTGPWPVTEFAEMKQDSHG